MPTTGLRESASMNFSPWLALDLVGETIEELGCLTHDTTASQFLDSMREPQLNEAATVVRRLGAEQDPPFRLRSLTGIRLRATTRARTVAR